MRDLLRVLTCGSVDDGKSTLIGRLLYEAQAIMDDTYTTLSRDSRPHPTSAWLFPHKNTGAKHRPQGHFGKTICRAIHRQTGVAMTLHRFRGFAASLILRDNPHALADVMALLGDSLETVRRYYMRHDRLGASARLAKVVEQRRGGGLRA